MKNTNLPYTQSIIDKILAAIEKVPTEDPKFTNDFNAGQKFAKGEIIKTINEIKL